MTESDLLSDLRVDANRYKNLLSKYNAGECTTSESNEIMNELIILNREITEKMYKIDTQITQIMLIMIGINTKVSQENEKRLDALEKRIEALEAEG